MRLFISEIRFVQVGETAAPTITLRAAALRSTALTILGTAGTPPRNVLVDAFQQVMALAAKGEIRFDTEQVPLADFENAWQRDSPGRRLVIIGSHADPAITCCWLAIGGL